MSLWSIQLLDFCGSKVTDLSLYTEGLQLKMLVNARFISCLLNKLPFFSAVYDVLLIS